MEIIARPLTSLMARFEMYNVIARPFISLMPRFEFLVSELEHFENDIGYTVSGNLCIFMRSAN